MKQFTFLGGVALISLTLVGCASTENTNESTTTETIEKNINIEELKKETEAAIETLPVNEAVADEIRSITTGETTESSTSEATTSVEIKNTTTETTAEEIATVEEETITTEDATTGTSSETPTEEPIAEEDNTSAGITMADVATHDSSSDCWMVIDGGVYDVTSYISSHPGGSDILRGCGIDATAMFSHHAQSAYEIKENYKIGDLAQ